MADDRARHGPGLEVIGRGRLTWVERERPSHGFGETFRATSDALFPRVRSSRAAAAKATTA